MRGISQCAPLNLYETLLTDVVFLNVPVSRLQYFLLRLSAICCLPIAAQHRASTTVSQVGEGVVLVSQKISMCMRQSSGFECSLLIAFRRETGTLNCTPNRNQISMISFNSFKSVGRSSSVRISTEYITFIYSNECTKVQNPRCHHVSKYYNAHVCFLQENGRPYVWLSTEGVLDLRNGAVSEKTPQIF